MLLVALTASAQRKKKVVVIPEPVPVDTLELRMNAYIDSLRIYKHLVDSLTQSNSAAGDNHRYMTNDLKYRMFSPLTYFPNVTSDQFAGGNIESGNLSDEASRALFHAYMNRPDLVSTTVSRLHASASRSEDSALNKDKVERKVNVTKESLKEKEVAIVQDPVDLVVYKPNFWKFAGDYHLQFMQNHLSENWYQKGESNLSMTGMANISANYNNKQKIKWDNLLEMKLGFQTSESDTIHKMKTSSDLLRYTGKFGVQATKNWYYTLQGIVTTQFARGYKSNKTRVYSDFFSPITINLSAGMDYSINFLNGKLIGNAHLAPFAYNWKHVSRLDLAKDNGIDEGHHSLQDYGSQITIDAEWKPSDKIKWKSKILGYTTYHRTEFQWENTILFSLSKYISTTLYLNPRFDDSVNNKDVDTFWQFKEYFSLGFSYSM